MDPQDLSVKRGNNLDQYNAKETIETSKRFLNKIYSSENKERLDSHIDSIREVINFGKHESMYYPGSGFDAFRALLAYEVQKLVAVDKGEHTLGDLEKKFKEMGKVYDLKIEEDRKVFQFEWEGRQRQIIEVREDLSDIEMSDYFDSDRPDILHTYLTNSSEYKDSGFSLKKYNSVETGGFVVMNEDTLVGDFLKNQKLPESLLKVMGLNRKEITRRPPEHILTSGAITDQLGQGFIYKKEKEVGGEIVETVLDYIYSDSFLPKSLKSLQEGAMLNFRLEGENFVNAFENVLSSFIYKTETLIDRLSDLGVEHSLLETIKAEIKKDLKYEINITYEKYKELVDKYIEMSQDIESGRKKKEAVVEEWEQLWDFRENEFKETTTDFGQVPIEIINDVSLAQEIYDFTKKIEDLDTDELDF